MSKADRDEAAGAIKQTLFTLLNSTRRYLEDGGGERLRAKIDDTLRMLHDAAHGLRSRGYPKAAGFIERNARFMVTFAELALEGIEIPYTTNRIERLERPFVYGFFVKEVLDSKFDEGIKLKVALEAWNSTDPEKEEGVPAYLFMTLNYLLKT